MGFEPSLFGAAKQSRVFKPPVRECGWLPLPAGSVLIAIDPSILNCGWGIVVNEPKPRRLDSGIFHPGKEGIDRYDHLSNLLRWRIRQQSETPEPITHAVIETPTGGQWARSATQLMVYARAIGVCEATCHRAGLKVNRVNVTEWKGGGKKSRTATFVKHFYGYDPRDSNEADALGLALWLCGRGSYNERSRASASNTDPASKHTDLTGGSHVC